MYTENALNSDIIDIIYSNFVFHLHVFLSQFLHRTSCYLVHHFNVLHFLSTRYEQTHMCARNGLTENARH